VNPKNVRITLYQQSVTDAGVAILCSAATVYRVTPRATTVPHVHTQGYGPKSLKRSLTYWYKLSVYTAVLHNCIFKLLKKSTTCFGPFSGWGHHQVETRISEKTHTLQCGLYMKNGGTRSRFTMVGEVLSYIYEMWNLR
jgi:hypothetical protein